MKAVVFTVIMAIVCSTNGYASKPSSDFIQEISSKPPTNVISYWEYYSTFQKIQDVNTAYVSIDSKLPTDRLKIINQLAFIKCVVELSMLQKSMEMLHELKKDIGKQDNYIKGSYYLVYARLLSRLRRSDEAIVANKKAIRYLELTQQLTDLKNAYLNQGYFYSTVNDSLAMVYYKKAETLEKKGVEKFYVLLRTNLANQRIIQNDLQSAVVYCQEAQHYMRNPKKYNYLDEFRVLIILASIYEVKGEINLEEFYLEKAKTLSIKHQMILNLTNIAYSQSFNYAQKKDYKNAYSALYEMDSLNRLVGINQISENLAVYDLEDKVAAEKESKRRISEKLAIKKQQQTIFIIFLAILTVALIGITVLLVKIRGKNKVLIDQNLKLAHTEEPRVKQENSSKNNHLELIFELEKLIYDRKLYEQSNLTIDRLAKKLNTNRSYLSEAINQHYKISYSNWINEVRINASRKLLASSEYDHYSIEGISKMVGYTSISSFNSSFKKITGLTPSRFKNHESFLLKTGC